uniref:Uncharacterized protein n=1 Tax=Meloidogyne enterolobii TaxID=390850 RepID=A0A6V7UVY8_MELEN|nr:unnamed protein product [Meloidogyne enterolobii]
MKEINEAYSVLSDKEKRQKYDSFGTADESSFYSNSGDFSQDSSFFDEIFNTFFGEKTSSSRKEETKTTDGSVYLELTLNFKESIFGIKKRFLCFLKEIALVVMQLVLILLQILFFVIIVKEKKL